MIRTQNHLVRKWTRNHLPKLAKWLGCVVSTVLIYKEFLLYVLIISRTRFWENPHIADIPPVSSREFLDIQAIITFAEDRLATASDFQEHLEFVICFISIKSIKLRCTKNEVSVKDFFSKCDQIRKKLLIWSHLLKKSIIENFIFV